MESRKFDPATFKQEYEEYARKMDLFMDGPTTTHFEQLRDAGVELPEPDAVDDADLRRKLWEVIAGLAKLRVFLDHTNHLTDRELYSKLWHEILRVETPAIDEIGFSTHVQPDFPDSEDGLQTHLKYYAGDAERESWSKDFPGDSMPAHQDPPFHRDDLLPGPAETVAEAAAWLRANWGETAFAANRFGATENALAFVNQLYEAGATQVCVDNEMMLPNHDWTPYADTLLVRMPEEPHKRRALFELMEHTGRPDEGGGDWPLIDCGQPQVQLWWD
jgi:hypothetical protein